MIISQQLPSTRLYPLKPVHQFKMPDYTQGHTSEMMAAHQIRSTSDSCGYFTPLLTSRLAAHILDVGCGPGSITADLAFHVPEGQVIGVDFAEEAIQKASLQPSLPTNCTFQVANVDDRLPFPDNSFDVVHAHQVLIHLSNPVHALAEMRRVCRPGGFVASRDGDWDTFTIFPESPSLKQYREIHGAIVRSSGAEPNAGRRLRYWAVQAGFSNDRITYSASPVLFTGAERVRYWSTVQAERYSKGTFKEQVLSKGLATEEDVAAFGPAWLEWGGQPGAVYHVSCGEVVCWKD